MDEASSYVEWLRDQSKKRGQRVDARVGDAQRLPAFGLEPASYDLAYARWVLCFVPDPRAVLAGMVKLVRPGGAVVIQDYLSYWMMSVAPAEPIFARIIEGICASWRRRGGDPDVMRRVPTWLAELGCKVEHVEPHFLAARPGTLLWEWPASFFRNFVPVLESKELITPAERREFEAAWERWSKSDHVFVTTPPLVELVARV